jgi:hypothetical protein
VEETQWKRSQCAVNTLVISSFDEITLLASVVAPFCPEPTYCDGGPGQQSLPQTPSGGIGEKLWDVAKGITDQESAVEHLRQSSSVGVAFCVGSVPQRLFKIPCSRIRSVNRQGASCQVGLSHCDVRSCNCRLNRRRPIRDRGGVQNGVFSAYETQVASGTF